MDRWPGRGYVDMLLAQLTSPSHIGRFAEPNLANSMAEKPFSRAIQERRATRHYEPTAVQEDDLRRILEAGLAAPSGYNLQPWRFVVVRDPEQRKRLRKAAMGQSKIEEAPAVIVACG